MIEKYLNSSNFKRSQFSSKLVPELSGYANLIQKKKSLLNLSASRDKGQKSSRSFYGNSLNQSPSNNNFSQKNEEETNSRNSSINNTSKSIGKSSKQTKYENGKKRQLENKEFSLNENESIDNLKRNKIPKNNFANISNYNINDKYIQSNYF